MPLESGSDKTLKYVGQSEDVRRAIVDTKGMGGHQAAGDKLCSQQL